MLIVWLISSANGGFPMEPMPDCGPENRDACPNDLDNWSLVSWIPDPSLDSVRTEELTLGSGIHLDRAIRHTAGRWDVPIAVLDSGVFWRRERLNRKLYLNAGELPVPLLASGEVAEVHDADGNGVFNIEDYRWDTRVQPTDGDEDGDDLLDPSDLIAVFSDGIDEDGNGFVDDISGWDFFSGDNNPFAQLVEGFASHGSGVAEEAANSGDDGGGIGVCPNCSIIPVRIGDAFIADARRVALAIQFSVDSGARSLAMATGGISHNDSVREAIDYAEQNGTVIVGAAGDENSYHHNFPAVENRILYVHSVRADNQNEKNGPARSFLSFFNCNNFGPRVDIVAPSTACATGATAKIAGAAGLVISAGLDFGQDLSAAQVRSILRATADDVYLSDADQSIVNTYPSTEGWDAFYGYGRVNVGTAIERIQQMEPGPSVSVSGPRWFSFIDDTLAVSGQIDGETWTASWGVGLEPEEWVPFASGTGPEEGELAVLDVQGILPPQPQAAVPQGVVARTIRAHEPLITVRIEATRNGHRAEDRVGVWRVDDPYLLEGWPKDMNASIESSAQLVDMDDDGVFEIVLATSDGSVHVLRGDGEPFPGFPVQTGYDPLFEAGPIDSPAYASAPPVREGILGAPAIGDIDGDGEVEIVVSTMAGSVYAWRKTGDLISGFPVGMQGRGPEEMRPGFAWDNGFYGSPALADVNQDGALEIIAGGGDQRFYVWDGNGQLFSGYPLDLCGPTVCGEAGARIVSSPALGDIDGDGDVDAVIGTNEVPVGAAGLLYAIDLNAATILEGYPMGRSGLVNQSILPVLGEGHVASPALADLDGDGDLEIASSPMLGTSNPIHHDGSDALELDLNLDRFGALASFTDGSLIQMINNPAFADMNGDSVPELLGGGASPLYLLSLPVTKIVEHQHGMGVWNGLDGTYLPGFPQSNDDIAFLSSPAVADVSGDSIPEVLYSSGGFFMYAADQMGVQAPGFPHFTGGWSIGSPSIGDVDGDGYLDVVLGTREGHLFVWTTEGRADAPVGWSGTRHDPANTGNASTPMMAQAGPKEGCCGTAPNQMTWLLLWPIGLLPWLRRRHRA